MNPDILSPGERCASTSNRNFEGRQGKGGRTHLVSPRWRRRPRSRATSSTSESGSRTDGAIEIIEGTVSVLDRADVDTDQIIPKQFLKRVERTGFGEFLFYDWIRDGEIELEPNPILVAGRNFGCGSSREHAPWALAGLRLRGDHRPVVRRHLLRQLHQDRPAAGDPRRGRVPGGRRGRARRGSTSTTRPSTRRPACAVRDRRGDQAPPAQRPRRHRRHAAERRGHRCLRGRARRADRGPVTTAL